MTLCSTVWLYFVRSFLLLADRDTAGNNRLVDLEELDLELEGRVGGLRSSACISKSRPTMTGGNPRAPYA